MAAVADIFNPQLSVVAKGLEGKSFLIYGGNSTGKTYQTVRFNKPFVLACESGLNAQSGVPYFRTNTWSDVKKIVRQFTAPATVDKAREMYDTIIIDEVYASSLLCQDYVINTYGEGALTLGDGTGKINLYQMYEKEYFKMINLLLSCDYTVVFIGHAQETKDGKAVPKGDKRCIDPIRDFVDYVVYVENNGVDEGGKVIKSSAYLAETEQFFARSRFEHTPTYLPEFTKETLEAAIIKGIQEEEKFKGIKAVSYQEQKEMNTAKAYGFDEIMDLLQDVGGKFAEAGKMDILTEIVENTLGAGKKVSQCTKKQVDALINIYDELCDKAKDLGL